MPAITININGQPTQAPESAIAYKFADPTEDARWIYDVDDLAAIKREDSSLIIEVQMTTEQAATLQSIERVMRADGFEPKLITRDLLSELNEFAPDYDFDADPLGASVGGASDGAIIVHRDPQMDDRYPDAGEHTIPDEGLIIQADGTTGTLA